MKGVRIMKKQENNEKPQASSLGPVTLLLLSVLLVFAALLSLEVQEIGEKLPKVSYRFKGEPQKTKKVLTQTFISLDDSNKNTPLFKQKSPGVEVKSANKTPSLVSKPSLQGETKLEGEALKKHLDSELKRAQDLVDSDDSENILQAKNLLEDILEKDPKHNESLKELAMIYMYDLDNTVKAEEFMLRSYEVSPNDAVFSEVVQLSRQNGTLDSFAESVNNKANKDPDNPAYASQAAMMLGVQGNYQESAEKHGLNAEKFNSHKEAKYSAIQYEKGGNKLEAMRMYNFALKVSELDPRVSESEKQLLRDRIKRLEEGR